jgi:hypothetical protein
MCSKCEAPPGAFVRVANVEPVSPWSLEAKSEEQSVHAEASNAMPAFVVKVEGRRRVDLDVVITGPDAARFDRPFVNEAGTTPFEQTYHVIFYVKGGTAVPPADGRWVVRATMYGYCRGEGECRAPEGERLRIVSIAPR